MRGTISLGVVVCAASACVGGDSKKQSDVSDTGGGDTLVLDTSVDTTPDTDPGGPVAIASFAVDAATITRGLDRRGATIEGSATLSWRTEHASSIRLLVDGVAVSLDGCTPSGSGPCASAGSLLVRPSEDTAFTLEALGPDGACDGTCPRETVAIAVVAPAIVTLETALTVVSAGDDATAAYTADAPTWQIGLSQLDDEGVRTFVACVPVSQATAESPCRISDDGQGNPLDAGLVVVQAVERGVTFAAVAENGADDGLGDIVLGDVVVDIGVPVEIAEFTATPAQALPGSDVVLAWDVHGAHAVAVDSPSAAVVGLSTCVGLGADGAGFCTVHIDADAHLGTVVFTLTGTQDTGALGEAHANIEIIGGPTLQDVSASPSVIVPGQPTTLRWTAYGADAVALGAAPDVVQVLVPEAGSCSGIGADGQGTCTITVANGTPAGRVNLTLTASHTTVGPAAVTTIPLDVLAGPAVTSFEVDDATVLATARLTLAWTSDNANFVVLGDDSGTLSPAALAACSAVDGANGHGSCVIQLPPGLVPGAFDLSLQAVGPTGARSMPAKVTITIGERPVLTFTASPLMLPAGGGDVTLSWTAVTGARVVVTDDADVPNTIVDSDEGTLCEDARSCAPAGDAITLTAVQSSTYTIVATNVFGSALASVRVSIEGAPVITALTLGGTDVRGAAAVAATTESELVWAVDAITENDTIRLERAPLPSPNGSCAAVAAGAWQVVDGFPQTGQATGTAMVSGLTRAAECFRFTAEDVDPTPTQREIAVFKVRKLPSLGDVHVSDNTVQPGDEVTLSWASERAYNVIVTASPVGAVTSQQLANCSQASGSCVVTLQTGTPLGDVLFSITAFGEEGVSTVPATVAVTLGVGAKLTSFSATPPSATGPTPVELAWASTGGTAIEIVNGESSVLTTNDSVVIGGGHVATSVTATTTWTLTVSNAFGSSVGQITVFVGPSIDVLSANGGNALDGNESVVTGPVTVAWSTTSATGSHILQRVKAPANSNCATANLAWQTVYEATPAPTASASHALGTIVDNVCVRLVVRNTEDPPQTSTATFLLRERPEIMSFTTSPNSIAGSGGTVIIDMGVRGATGLALTAQYRAANGEVLGTRNVCGQGSLNSGTLTGTAEIDQVACAHTIAACNLLCLNNGMPSGTKSVRYVLSIGDAEGDAANATTAGGEDVTVQ